MEKFMSGHKDREIGYQLLLQAKQTEKSNLIYWQLKTELAIEEQKRICLHSCFCFLFCAKQHREMRNGLLQPVYNNSFNVIHSSSHFSSAPLWVLPMICSSNLVSSSGCNFHQEIPFCSWCVALQHPCHYQNFATYAKKKQKIKPQVYSLSLNPTDSKITFIESLLLFNQVFTFKLDDFLTQKCC